MLGKEFIENLRAEVAFRQIVTQDHSMLEVLQRLKNVASTNVNVLLCGETGTGKELCAQAMHFLAAQRDKPFIAFNCGIGPLELFDSILFGHTRGAFTNAVTERSGLLQEADQGILFLDELNSLPYTIQVKLNRFLETGEYRRLGENKIRRVDVRVIAASNRPLQSNIEENSFRKDLYYRIAEYVIELPPLRQRKKDIRLLLDHFLDKYKVQYQRPCIEFTEDAYLTCEKYSWPGNIRELENLVKRCLIDTPGNQIYPGDLKLSAEVFVTPSSSDYFSLPLQEAKSMVVREFEKSYLRHRLQEHDGNVEECARQCGKHRSAFWALLKKHEIDPNLYRSQIHEP